MGEHVRQFWDLVGLMLAGGIFLLMLAGLIVSLRETPPYLDKSTQFVLDCLVILTCMWAVWYLGRWW